MAGKGRYLNFLSPSQSPPAPALGRGAAPAKTEQAARHSGMHSRVLSASFYVPFQLCTGPALCSHRRLLDRMDRNCAAQGR